MSTTFYDPDNAVSRQARMNAEARAGCCDEASTDAILGLCTTLTMQLENRLGRLIGSLHHTFKESLRLERELTVVADPIRAHKCMGDMVTCDAYHLPVGTTVSLKGHTPGADKQVLFMRTPRGASLTVEVNRASFTPVVRVKAAHGFKRSGRGASPRGSKNTTPDTGIS